MGAMVAASLIGMAGSFYLVSELPLLLVALSPLGRHVVLAAPVVDPVALGLVLVLRRQAFYTASFFLGRSLGTEVIPWIEQRLSHAGRFVRLLERLFVKAPRLVVLAMAGPLVSALAGISGMALGTYLALAASSLVLRAALMVGFAEWTEVYLQVIRGWVEEYRGPGTLVMVVAVGLYWWRRGARVPLDPPPADAASSQPPSSDPSPHDPERGSA